MGRGFQTGTETGAELGHHLQRQEVLLGLKGQRSEPLPDTTVVVLCGGRDVSADG